MTIHRSSTWTNPHSWQAPNVILVEGVDDQHFVCSQLNSLQAIGEWEVYYTGGTSVSLAEIIGDVIHSSFFSKSGHSISIVQDADNNPRAAADGMKHAFRKNSLAVPIAHAQVDTSQKINTGFFVMPDGTSTGELEDLLVLAIPDPARKKAASDFVNNLPGSFPPLFKPAKNLLQSYFATHQEFVKWIGNAVLKSNVIPVNSQVFQPFQDFLRELQT